MAYYLPELDYSYGALEPFIDSETMHFHHDKHHRAYVDSLNNAVAEYPQFDNTDIETLLRQLDKLPEGIRASVRDNGGGHANHELFWKVIGPPNDSRPEGQVADAIRRDFGGVENFQQEFTAAATKVFGAGWTFLAADPVTQKLEIINLPNQDTPLLHGKAALLCCDVWEHSYYLKYQNRRRDYLNAWWNVVQWDAVNPRMESFQRNAIPA